MTAAILTHEPPPISSRIPTTPASLDRVVKKCLSKDPDERWQSANDLASALRWSADDTHGSPSGDWPDSEPWTPSCRDGDSRPSPLRAALIAAAVWAVGSGRRGSAASAPTPRFIPVTFRAGTLTAARFAPDGDSIVYSAAWGVDPYGLFMTRRDNVESRRLDVPNAKLLGVSSSGELAFLRGPHSALRLLNHGSRYASPRLHYWRWPSGAPRRRHRSRLEAWRDDLAVVRRGQVEFPLGTKIYGQHRFRHVRIAPDGQRLALVEGLGRDAEGRQVAAAIVLLDRSGRKTTLSSGWGDLTSLAWSPSGDEVWFTANRARGPYDFGPASRVHRRERTRDPSLCIGFPDRYTMSSPTAVCCFRATSLGWGARACRRVKLNREISGGSMVQRQRHSRRMDERCSWAKCCEAEVQHGSIYLRGTDGSDAVRLGDGFPEDLSPDGKWVLAAPSRYSAPLGHLADRAGIAKNLTARTPRRAVRGELSAGWTSHRVRRA